MRPPRTHEPPDFGGARLQLRDAQLALARGFLAVRRGDRGSAETLLIAAQRCLALVAVDLPEDRSGAVGGL